MSRASKQAHSGRLPFCAARTGAPATAESLGRIDAPRLPHRTPNKLLPEHLAAVERALWPADGVAALRAMPTDMLHPGHRPPAGHIPGLATERTLHALPGWRAPGRARWHGHHDPGRLHHSADVGLGRGGGDGATGVQDQAAGVAEQGDEFTRFRCDERGRAERDDRAGVEVAWPERSAFAT